MGWHGTHIKYFGCRVLKVLLVTGLQRAFRVIVYCNPRYKPKHDLHFGQTCCDYSKYCELTWPAVLPPVVWYTSVIEIQLLSMLYIQHDRGCRGLKASGAAKMAVPACAYRLLQLTEVNKELQDLRAELESVRTGVRDREASLLHKEELIRELQSKAAAEHEAKTKAQLALLDRAEALQDCKAKHTALAGEVAQCHSDLSAVLAGEVHKQRKSQYTV